MNLQGITTQPDPYKPYLLSQAIKAGPFVLYLGKLVTITMAISSQVDLQRKASKHFRTLTVHSPPPVAL